jgi:hypothetical protein
MACDFLMSGTIVYRSLYTPLYTQLTDKPLHGPWNTACDPAAGMAYGFSESGGEFGRAAAAGLCD